MQLPEFSNLGDQTTTVEQSSGEPPLLDRCSPSQYLSIPNNATSESPRNTGFDPQRLLADLLSYRQYLEESGTLIPATPMRIEEFERPNACKKLYYDPLSRQYYEQGTPTQIPKSSPVLEPQADTIQSPSRNATTSNYICLDVKSFDAEKTLEVGLLLALEDVVRTSEELKMVIEQLQAYNTRGEIQRAEGTIPVHQLLRQMEGEIARAQREIQSLKAHSGGKKKKKVKSPVDCTNKGSTRHWKVRNKDSSSKVPTSSLSGKPAKI
ncbi:hypothetical protein FRC17_007233 [Serendipita sp. 399]|nr:hypothetical protein FRC17_007233 [Serendipita sp. 399]